MAARFVPVEKVSGLCVQVRIPVAGASTAAFHAARCMCQLAEQGEKVEMGAVCAAAADAVEVRVSRAGSAPARTIRAGSFCANISEGNLCLSLVTDKSLRRVIGFVKQALAVAAGLSASAATHAIRGAGVRPTAVAKCVQNLRVGCSKATVVVCGPALSLKVDKRAKVLEAIAQGVAAAKVSGGGTASTLSGASPAISQAGQHAMSGSGAALVLAQAFIVATVHCPARVVGDYVVVPERNVTDIRKKGAGAKAVLVKQLKAGDEGRAYWRACAQGVYVKEVQDANTLAGAVAVILKK